MFFLFYQESDFLKHSKLSGNFASFVYHLREESISKCQIVSFLQKAENEGLLIFSATHYSITMLKMEPKFHATYQRLVVEQFKCWHYSMKQPVVRFTHVFPSNLCQYRNANGFMQMSSGFNVSQAGRKLSKDKFVPGFRTVHWHKNLLLSELCYKASVLATKKLSQKIVGLRVIQSSRGDC